MLKTAAFVRKASDVEDLFEAVDRGAKEPFVVDEKVVLSESEFDSFCEDLLATRSFLAGKGGDVKIDGRFARKCVLVECSATGRKLAVDPQGYDYARYAALVI